MLLDKEPELEFIGMAGSRSEAVEMTIKKRPDLILLDVGHDEKDFVDFIPELLGSDRSARVLLLTGKRDPDFQKRAVRLGAMGVLSKDSSVEVLVKAIKKIHAGEVWLDRSMLSVLLHERDETRERNPAEEQIATLTKREREIIALIAEGLKNRQVGKRLFISETTVTHHLSSIFSKLEVSDRLELALYAFRHKLAKSPE